MKKITAILLVLMMVFGLCSCGGSMDSYKSEVEYMPADNASGELNFSAGGSAYTDYESPAEAPSAPGSAATSSEKLVYHADLTITTTAFDSAIAQLEDLAFDMGGFIESSDVSGNYRYSDGSVSLRSASYVLRVPSERFRETVSRTGELGMVQNSSTGVDNITPQFVDQQARKHSLEVQEERLLAMMEKAEDVSTMIELEDRISSVRYEIEYIETTLRNWQNQVDYSTVRVYLREVEAYSPEGSGQQSFGAEMGEAFGDGWSGFVYAMRGLMLFIARFLPAILIIAAIVTVTLVIVFRQRKKRRERMQAMMMAQMQQPAQPMPPQQPAE